MDKAPQIAEEQHVITIDKTQETKLQKYKGSCFVFFSADISKSKEISRWRLIDKALHYDFSATKKFFKNCHNFFIIRTKAVSSNGLKKKRNEAFAEITRWQTDTHTQQTDND